MVSDALKKWVKNAKQQGLSAEQIKQALTKQGYSDADKIMGKKSKKTLIIISSIVIIIIIIIAGLIFGLGFTRNMFANIDSSVSKVSETEKIKMIEELEQPHTKISLSYDNILATTNSQHQFAIGLKNVNQEDLLFDLYVDCASPAIQLLYDSSTQQMSANDTIALPILITIDQIDVGTYNCNVKISDYAEQEFSITVE